VAVVSPAVQRYVPRAIGVNGATALPQLVAELGMRVAQEPDVEHPLVVAAPRYVDASVTSAVQAIRDTSRSTFSTPVSLRDAVAGHLLPTARSRLARVPASAPALPDSVLSAATRVADALPDLTARSEERRV